MKTLPLLSRIRRNTRPMSVYTSRYYLIRYFSIITLFLKYIKVKLSRTSETRTNRVVLTTISIEKGATKMSNQITFEINDNIKYIKIYPMNYYGIQTTPTIKTGKKDMMLFLGSGMNWILMGLEPKKYKQKLKILEVKMLKKKTSFYGN